MSAIDLVQAPSAGRARPTIREQLDGNMCRCTGYQNIVKAVAGQGAAADAGKLGDDMGASITTGLPHIGESVRRKEDCRFLTGAGQYTDDINAAAQTYAVFVRSPHAHATIRSIDIARAEAMPGVRRRLHRQGHRGQDGRAALRLADHQHRRHSR